MSSVKKWLLLCFAINFCHFVQAQFASRLIQIDSIKYKLIVNLESDTQDSIVLTKRFPYNVFKIRQADIDKDGAEEIILGVQKITHFDSIVRTRINIYSVDSNKIAPKWLGSFMSHPLYDFELSYKNNFYYIVTIEHERNNLFLIAEYEWHSFGLRFIQYLKRSVNLDEAKTILLNPYENL